MMELEMSTMTMKEYTLPLPNEHVTDDEEESSEDQYHPLLNHAILEKVFEHLRGQDLKACRAVCRKWNESSIPFIRSKYLITLDTHDIENFVELCRESKIGIPFGRFDLRLLMTGDAIYQEFLSVCGNTIQEMSLLHCQELFVEDVAEILRSTPTLETFHTPGILGSCSGDIVKLFQEDTKPKLNSLKKLHVEFNFNGKRIKICPTFLEDIFRTAVNIRDISVDSVFTWIDEDGNPHCYTMEVLGLIVKLGRESSIKTLDLMNVSTQHIELLSRMGSNQLKLEKFRFTLPKRVDEFQVFEAIYPFKHSLRSLDIRSGADTMGLPYMPRLKELKFQIKKDFKFGRVNLKNMFPALETLYMICYEGIQTDDFEEFDEFFPNSVPCPNIKSLKLDHVSLKLNAFNDVRRILPNLSELKLKLSTTDGVEILRNIWTRMTELKVLSLTGEVGTNEDLDSIFTGIPIDLIHRIQDIREITDLEKMTVECRREKIEKMRNQHCQFPSITNLTKLRSLHVNVSRITYVDDGRKRLSDMNDPGAYSALCSGLRRLRLCENGTAFTSCSRYQPLTGLRYFNLSTSVVDSDRNSLTDLSGYLALYPLKHLRHLDVQNCEFTKACCENLKTDMELESCEFQTLKKDDQSVLLSASRPTLDTYNIDNIIPVYGAMQTWFAEPWAGVQLGSHSSSTIISNSSTLVSPMQCDNPILK